MNVNWTMLKETWNMIQHAFTTFGPRVLVWMLIVIAFYALGKLMNAWVASRKKPVEKSPDIQFLEGALDEDPLRKPNPDYTYAEFQHDLHDKGLTFEEIYEKCGGVFPKKPEPGAGNLGFYGPPGIEGRDGPQGPNGSNPPPGSDGRFPGHMMNLQEFGDGRGNSTGRMKELQEWFKERGKTSHVGGLVPPPPNPYPIIHKIYIRGRR